MAPSNSLWEYIEGEVVSGFKGGMVKKIARISKSGVVTTLSSGSYPYGIRQQRSPDGSGYAPMSPVTLKLRMLRGDSRHPSNPSTSLMDTEEMIRDATTQRRGNRIILAFGSIDNDIKSLTNEAGGVTTMKLRRNKRGQFSKSGRTVQEVDVDIPSRPHRDMQWKVTQVIASAMKRWFDRG